MSTNLEAVEVTLHVERELISIMRTVAISGSWNEDITILGDRQDVNIQSVYRRSHIVVARRRD